LFSHFPAEVRACVLAISSACSAFRFSFDYGNDFVNKNPLTETCLTLPPPYRAFLIDAGLILAVGLVGHDPVIGNRIGTGSLHVPQKEPYKSSLRLKNVLLLTIDIEEIQLAGLVSK